jgi:menaquinone-dependent protoporphyrinogen oxidase
MTVTKKVLIAYATVHGSTAEIAEFMGQMFGENHFDVTVANVETLESVAGYDAYILGSAIHAGMWLTPMSRFLDRFENELAKQPLYFFITCIRILEPDGYQHALENYVHRDTLEKIGARDIAIFAGKLRLDAIDLRDRWTLSLRYDGSQAPGMLNDDYRDWNAIRNWTARVRSELEKSAL